MAEIFFGDPFRRLLLGRPILREWPGSSAAMDWLETPSSHIIRVNIPGLGREDVKIQLEEGNVLEIKGEARKKEEEEEEVKEAVWHVGERGKAGFERRVALPENVRAEQIKAHVENGVLTVVAPKEPVPAKQKPRSIPVLSKL